MAFKILVVEDEEVHRSLLERILQKSGFEPVFAADGISGRKILEKVSVDAAILDWNLPGMNGGELARWIRKNPKTSRMPVIMLTVRRAPDQEVLGFESGADDYLPKPYTPQELIARLNRLLDLRRQK